MLKNFLHLCLLFIGLNAYAQPNLNMELLSNVQFDEVGNDIWGFVDSAGTEYAVMGTRTATRIYSLEDPRNPIERYVVNGAASTWRDIKYYNDHLYVTTDSGADGLTIIDCSMAPDSFSFTRWQPVLEAPNGSGTLERTHNLYIDTDTGICYLAGHNVSNRGVILLDLKQDPKEPVVISYIDEFYSHDAYVKDGKLFSSEILVGDLAIYDVSNPELPVEITRQETSRNFCHNAWATDDNNYVFTTDERNDAWMDSYDVSKDGEAILLDRFRALETLDLPVIPHNTHVLGNYAITSWYTDGLVVTDISKPDNLVKVAHYDTYSDEGTLNPNGGSGWFKGAWGAYPYLPSGHILVSDINTGLYVFGIDYEAAARLEGVVLSNVSCEENRPIPDVKVEILGGQLAFDNTNSNGIYRTGLEDEGSFKVAVSHPDYISDTFDVEMIKGEVTTLNVSLSSPLSCLITKVIDENNKPVQAAKVVFFDLNTGEEKEYTTDQDGSLKMVTQVGLTYQIAIAKWGHLHTLSEEIITTDEDQELIFMLEDGYQDDFFVDLGWKVISNALRGDWVRAEPIGTLNGNTPSNPEFDISDDISDNCYVTGNGQSNNVGAFDVDEGITTIQSPAMLASGAESMRISYYSWFYNDGGQAATLGDTMFIYLSNGVDQIILEKYMETQGTGWSDEIVHTITKDDIDFTDDMSIIVAAGDYADGHLVEGGFDGFKAEFMFASNTTESELSYDISLSPNPTTDQLTLEMESSLEGKIQIIDVLGTVLASHNISGFTQSISVIEIPAGKYFAKIIANDRVKILPFIKI